jgi:hypothetical protein
MRITVATGLTILILAMAFGPAAAQSQHRLPKGYAWGRCLLVVDGKTQISGKCGYHISKGGAFEIAGARQVYEGIDYRNPSGSGAGQMSKDYWGNLFRDDDGTWTGYSNSEIDLTHGDQRWGTVKREGACYVNDRVRVCLWAK